MIDPFASATALLQALRGKKFSSLELTDLYIGRIERHDAKINVVVVRDFERARAAARAADAARSRGEERPLLGLPLTLKESINVRGLPTCCGVAAWKDFVSQHDAPATLRVQAAGGVLLGKTNIPVGLADWQSVNPVYGRTNNPWDLARSPGGSTGGAAALAAGFSALEVGSDIGGSIRVPAAFCGVYGHRPSDTALPRSGQFPLPPTPNPAVVMGVQGPLGRSAEDLELALDLLAGADVGEDVAWKLALPPARAAQLKDFRVAILPPPPWVPLDAEIEAGLERVAALLGSLGAQLRRAQPPEMGDWREHYRLYRRLLCAMMAARVPAAESARWAQMQRAVGEEFARAAAEGTEASVSDYFGWLLQREKFRAAWRSFFLDCDIVLAPITLVPAFAHLELADPLLVSAEYATVDINGKAERYVSQLFPPSIATLAGQPATAFPIGLSKGGLPLALQAIGPYLEDRTPLRFTALLAKEIGGFVAPPGFAA
jgi:amidase